MDKYVEADIMKRVKTMVLNRDYKNADALVNGLEVDKIKNSSSLCLIGEVYMNVGKLDEAEQVLLRAYDRSPKNRWILSLLTNLYIDMESYNDAERYYKEFINVASRDIQRYILRYKIDRGKGENLNVQIDTLERLKDYEYIEEWAYELATLYKKAGEDEKCIKECNEIQLWFGTGEYANKAIRLRASITGEEVDIPEEDRAEKIEIPIGSGAYEDTAELPEVFSAAEEADKDNRGVSDETISGHDETVPYHKDTDTAADMGLLDIAVPDDEETKEESEELPAEESPEMISEDEASEEEQTELSEDDEVLSAEDIEEEQEETAEEEKPLSAVEASGIIPENEEEEAILRALLEGGEEAQPSEDLLEDDVIFPTPENSAELEIEVEEIMCDEVAAAFSEVANIESLQGQLAKAFNHVVTGGQAGRSYVVDGDDEVAKSCIMLRLPRFLSDHDICSRSKTVRTAASNLNGKDFRPIFQRLKGGCVKISNAQKLDEWSIAILSEYLRGEHKDVIIILETGDSSRFWGEHEAFKNLFDEFIQIKKYNSLDLLGIAKSCVEDNGYELSFEASVTLKDHFDEMLKKGINVEYDDIIDLVSQAIRNLDNRIIQSLIFEESSKRYMNNDMITLSSEDFLKVMERYYH